MIGLWVYLLAVVLMILQAVDGYTTREILKRGGKELNPVMQWMFHGKKHPSFAIIATKVVASAIGFGLAWLSKGMIGAEFTGLLALVALYIMLALNNITVLRDMGDDK